MALYAHYKAFCCVMISLARPAAYIIVPNPFSPLVEERTPFIERRAGPFLRQLLGNKLQDWRTSSKNGPCHATLDLVTSS